MLLKGIIFIPFLLATSVFSIEDKNSYTKKEFFSLPEKERNPLSNSGTLSQLPLISIGICENITRINVFGDLTIGPRHIEAAPSFFKHVDQILEQASFNIVNLEGSLSAKRQRAFPESRFAVLIDEKAPAILKRFHISHVTRANNHAMDFGEEGRLLTDSILTEEKIAWAGVGNNYEDAIKPIEITHANKTIAVYSFTTTHPMGAWAKENRSGVAAPRVEKMKEIIKSARSSYDFIVVIYHWGPELSPTPLPHQTVYAKEAIRGGADVVIGHHAHIPQSIELFENKYIIYGLGNFIFTPGSDKPRVGLIAQLEFCKEETRSLHVRFIPINTSILETGFRVKPLTHTEFRKEFSDYIKNNHFHANTLFSFVSKPGIMPITAFR